MIKLKFAMPMLLCMGTAWAEQATTPPDSLTVFGDDIIEELARAVGSAYVVDEKQLQKAAYDDVNRVLNQVPGLYIREEDGYGLRPNIGLRGANSDRSQKVTLMEDGVLFGPAPYAAPAAYYFPLTVRMTEVEVYKGSAAIQYGPQTIGGAINLVSAPITEEPSALLSVAAGTDAYRRAHIRVGGLVHDDFSMQLEGVHIGTDGFKTLRNGGDTGFVKNELQLKMQQLLGEGWLELRLGYADEVSDESYLGLSDGDFAADPYQRYLAGNLDRFESEWYGLRLDFSHPAFGGWLDAVAYSHQYSRAWRKFNNVRGTDIRAIFAAPNTAANRLQLQVLRGDIDSNPNVAGDDILVGTNDRDFRSSGVQGRVRWDFGDDWFHGVELGLRLHSDRIRRLHDEFGYESSNGELVQIVFTRPREHIATDNTGRANAIALWLLDEINVGRWTIVPGVRIEHIQTEFTRRPDRLNTDTVSNKDSYSVVLPGLGLNYAQTENLSWLFGIHRGFSPASPALNDGIEPEDAINTELGLRWRGGWGRFDVVGFHSLYDNLTAICTFSAGCAANQIGTQTNAGEVKVYGLEFDWGHALDLGQGYRLPLAFSYTFTQGEFKDSFQSNRPQLGNVQAGFELPYLPEHRAHGRIGLETATWDVQLSATYVSEMRDVAGQGQIIDGVDAYSVLDLSAGYALSNNARLKFRIDNLLDDDYISSRRPFGARPGKPLSVVVGVDLKF